jgi:hypothetical protein
VVSAAAAVAPCFGETALRMLAAHAKIDDAAAVLSAPGKNGNLWLDTLYLNLNGRLDLHTSNLLYIVMRTEC